MTETPTGARTFTVEDFLAKAETADLKARNATNRDQKQWYRDAAAQFRQAAAAAEREAAKDTVQLEQVARLMDRAEAAESALTESRAAVARLTAENERLKRLSVHCDKCGADYAATGIEAGCPCVRLATYQQAVGVATTLKGDMEINVNNPIDMMQQVVSYVGAERERAGELASTLKDLVEDCEWYSADTYDREAPHQLGAFERAKKLIALGLLPAAPVGEKD